MVNESDDRSSHRDVSVSTVDYCTTPLYDESLCDAHPRGSSQVRFLPSPITMRRIHSPKALILILACLFSVSDARQSARAFQSPALLPRTSVLDNRLPMAVLDLRGGVQKKKKSSKSKSSTERTATGKKKVQTASKTKETTQLERIFRDTKPVTKWAAMATALVSIFTTVLGELGQDLVVMDPMRTVYGIQLWRPLTAAAYMGPPNLGWVFSLYYLHNYGSSLENSFGSAQHIIFLGFQIALLTTLASIMGLPNFNQGIITAMLHVLARAAPRQKVRWLVMDVPYWMLPYAFMASDVLQAQGNPMAAVPHVLGMLTGHLYHFVRYVWPQTSPNAPDWLQAPTAWVNLVEGAPEETTTDIPKPKRNRKKGRKLAS